MAESAVTEKGSNRSDVLLFSLLPGWELWFCTSGVSQLNQAVTEMIVIMRDGEVSFVFNPFCFAPLLAIDSRINSLNGFDWEIVDSNREEQI